MAEIEHEPQNDLIYHAEGPIYQNGVWIAQMILKERKSEPLQGQTKEEVQEQVLHFLSAYDVQGTLEEGSATGYSVS